MFFVHLSDTVRNRRLRSDGSYVRIEPDGEPLDSQAWMLENFTARTEEGIGVDLPGPGGTAGT